ncbi:MAG: DUF4491 family protein [Marinifilaceae bacterium]|nr:DUF4491 family protein [Marinifilaceae bacterium]
MNFEGIVIGVSTFLIIGMFHPIVIKSEYHFGTKCWWLFTIFGIACTIASLFIGNTLLASITAVIGFSSFWSILEIFEQRERVNKGWFPANPKRKGEYKITSYNYRYPHPAITADCLLFAYHKGELEVLLIERGGEPYKGYWAIPGGFMEMDETTESCSRREMMEETGIKVNYLKEVKSYSNVNRDPRERVVTITYCTLEQKDNVTPEAGDDAQNVAWFPIRNLPKLAFDHKEMIIDSIHVMKCEIEIAIKEPNHPFNSSFTNKELNECIKILN